MSHGLQKNEEEAHGFSPVSHPQIESLLRSVNPTEASISTDLTLLWDDFADLAYHIQQPPTVDITARIIPHLDLPRIDWVRQRLKRLFGTQ
jgi:hypothetical protein